MGYGRPGPRSPVRRAGMARSMRYVDSCSLGSAAISETPMDDPDLDATIDTLLADIELLSQGMDRLRAAGMARDTAATRVADELGRAIDELDRLVPSVGAAATRQQTLH